MINGNEYSYEDINVVFPGSPLPADGVVAIEYEYKKDHVNIYGRGAKPVAAGRGKEEPNGSITILQSLLESIQRSLPKGKNLTHMKPFPVTCTYLPEDGPMVTDGLVYCRVAAVKKGMKSGDPNMEIQLPLVIGDIKYNI